MRLIVASALLLSACSAAPAVGTLRFHNREPVMRVNDRHDVKQPPRPRATPSKTATVESLVFRRFTRALRFPTPQRARNINSMGDVPDSTWFENRIGLGRVSAKDMERGPNTGKEPVTPFVITESKLAGKSVGFVVRDSRGDKYVIKFEKKGFPLYETATDIVVQRLLWAAGYHVPENHISFVRPSELSLADDAVIRDFYGNTEPLSQEEVDEDLAEVHLLPDGRYRVLASKYVPGKNVGGFPQEGVRKDDPNDVIPHQHRRELRGLYVFMAWLQSTDLKEGNTVDAWVEDADAPGQHFVMHYLVDFGKSLGVFVTVSQRPADGHVRAFDLTAMLKSLPTLGLWKRPWEGVHDPHIDGLAPFDAEHFDPGKFEEQLPFAPFLAKDQHDMYWATKILLKFSRAHIRAAVASGFSNPKAIDYLTKVLVARQRKSARYWLRVVNPLDTFRVSGGANKFSLCFEDLLIRHELDDSPTRYRARSYDFDGRAVGFDLQVAGNTAGRYCIEDITAGKTNDNYTIVRLDTRRNDDTFDPVEVHIASHKATYRVIGINRR
jgi:hypothetical protein